MKRKLRLPPRFHDETEERSFWEANGSSDYVDWSRAERQREVWLGAEAKVPLTVGKDFVVTLPRKSRKDMKVAIDYDRPIPAPVKQGDTVGKIASVGRV